MSKIKAKETVRDKRFVQTDIDSYAWIHITGIQVELNVVLMVVSWKQSLPLIFITTAAEMEPIELKLEYLTHPNSNY